MDISIVIPVFDEEASVKPLYEAIVRSMDSSSLEYEILLVDDGSRDNTFHNACQLARQNSRLRIIKLNKNYGQTAALSAGFENARGDIIVTMDGDLQNDPDDIPKLIEKIYEGYDIVVGWREKRKDNLWTKKIPSLIANRIINKITRIPIRDNGCALRGYRAEVINNFPLYSEMHRLLPVITGLAGAKIAEIRVNHRPRKYGKSKYGLSRTYKVLLDLLAIKTILTSFHIPLFGFGFWAIMFAFFGIAALLLGTVQAVLRPGEPIIITMGISMLLGSLSLFFLILGIICDLIYKSGNLKIENLLKKTGRSENPGARNLEEMEENDVSIFPDHGNRKSR